MQEKPGVENLHGPGYGGERRVNTGAKKIYRNKLKEITVFETIKAQFFAGWYGFLWELEKSLEMERSVYFIKSKHYILTEYLKME